MGKEEAQDGLAQARGNPQGVVAVRGRHQGCARHRFSCQSEPKEGGKCVDTPQKKQLWPALRAGNGQSANGGEAREQHPGEEHTEDISPSAQRGITTLFHA